MAVGKHGLYTGGKGVLIRSMFDGATKLKKTQVVSASLIVDDIRVPGVVFPASGPDHGLSPIFCPNNGSSGYNNVAPCVKDKHNETGPYNYAQLGVAVGSSMSHFFHMFDEIQDADYDWGVFYATDANSADRRCRYMPQYNGYDCPGYFLPWNGTNMTKTAIHSGAGQFAPGNPYKNNTWGGGAGCHFADYNPKAGIDQTDGYDSEGRNLVSDRHCQCNAVLKSGGAEPWDAWVDSWIQNSKPHPTSPWQKWFGGGKFKAPSFAMDFAACWMNNPRNMISLQNAIWKRAYDWSNQMIPASNWQIEATSQRSYWGWNEVPVSVDVDSPAYWDAIFIKLPLAICNGEGDNDTVSCLSQHAQQELEVDLDKYVATGYLVVGEAFLGQRPGSAVAFLREKRVDQKTRWVREFFCEPWTGPSGKYKVVSTKSGCYLDHASTPASTLII